MLLKNWPVLLPGEEVKFRLFAKSFSKICCCGCDSKPKLEMAVDLARLPKTVKGCQRSKKIRVQEIRIK